MQPENLKCISTRLFPFIMKVKDFTTNGFIDTSQGSYEVLETIQNDQLHLDKLNYIKSKFYKKESSKTHIIFLELKEEIFKFFPHICFFSPNFGLNYQQTENNCFYQFYSINKKIQVSIKEEDIIVKPSFIDKLKDITESNNLSDEEKHTQLKSIFDYYGFLIPLKITFGAKLVANIETETQINEKMLKASIESKINNLMNGSIQMGYMAANTTSNYKASYSGVGSSKEGLLLERDIFGWYRGISEDNYAPVWFSAIKTILDFLPVDLKTKIVQYNRIIPQNYRDYHEKYLYFCDNNNIYGPSQKLRAEKGISDENFFSGYIDSENPWIRTKKIVLIKKAGYNIFSPYNVDRIYGELPNLCKIVGWRLNSLREDQSYNASWVIENDPLSVRNAYKRYSFRFESAFLRDIKYELILFYINKEEKEYYNEI